MTLNWQKLALGLVIGTVTILATGCGSGVFYSIAPTLSPAPAVLNLAPAFSIDGAPSQVVTITGTGFQNSSSVTYKGSQHTATVLSSQKLTISLSSSDLVIPGNYQIVVSNPGPGGGTASALFQVWQTLPDTTTGMSFSMPVFGDSTTLASDTSLLGEGHVIPYVHNNSSNENDSPFGFHIFPNPLQLNLPQWFEKTIDINGQLLSSGAYKQQTLPDGSALLTLDPTVGLPEAYVEANDGNIQLSAMYRITSSGQVVSLFTSQEVLPNSDLNGISGSSMGSIELNAFGTVHF